MHPEFLKGAALEVAVRMGSPRRNEEPLPCPGGVFLTLYADMTLPLGDEVKFVLVEPVSFAFPGKIRGTEKTATGVAHHI